MKLCLIEFSVHSHRERGYRDSLSLIGNCVFQRVIKRIKIRVVLAGFGRQAVVPSISPFLGSN